MGREGMGRKGRKEKGKVASIVNYSLLHPGFENVLLQCLEGREVVKATAID